MWSRMPPSAIARSVSSAIVLAAPVAGERVRAQQKQQLGRPRKLRRAAEPAVPRVERLRERRDARHRARRGRRPARGRARPRRRRVACRSRSRTVSAELHRRRARSFCQARASCCEQLDEPGPAPPRRRRKVGAAEERLQVGRQPHAHRPAAGAGRGLDEHHVDAIDVRPLLAIDLDRHEVLVEHRRDRGVLERLVLHDVAPVARRVADRQKDRLVLLPRPLERLVAPRIPVHGVVRVLQQVRDCARAPDGSAWS